MANIHDVTRCSESYVKLTSFTTWLASLLQDLRLYGAVAAAIYHSTLAGKGCSGPAVRAALSGWGGPSAGVLRGAEHALCP